MADPNDPKTTPEEPAEPSASAASTPQQPQPGSSPTSAAPEAGSEPPAADAVGETAEPNTEAEADAADNAPINPAAITVRDTIDAVSHTVPLDLATVDDVADHVAETFAPEIEKFINNHPGARHFMTVAVHIGGALVHSRDVGEQNTRAATALADLDKLTQFLSTRFPAEQVPSDYSRADVIIGLLNRAFPVPAGSAGLAAANRR